MNHYFRSKWAIVVVIMMILLSSVFGAGVWYMIAVGMYQALGPWGAYGLASIAAPIVAIASVTMFVFGEQIKKNTLDYEHVNGKIEVRDENDRLIGYKEAWSKANWVMIIKCAVFIMDSMGIWYRVLVEPIDWPGKILLIIFLEILAYIPWPIGQLVYMSAHRPAMAVRRDVDEIIEVASAHAELQQASNAFKKRATLPPHIRQALPAPQREAPNFTPALVTEEAQQHQSQNGKN